MTEQETLPAHSNTIGGSSAGRVLACPASYELCKTMPREPESAYAAEGTALHQAMEAALTQGLLLPENQPTEPSDRYTFELVGEEFYGITITDDHVAECINPALRQFDEIYTEYDKDPGGVQYKLEQRVAFPGIPNAFGTADVLLATQDRAAVIDWKFGGGVVVAAEENSQMLYYATAAVVDSDFFLVDETVSAGEASTHIEMVIIQPRVNGEEPSRWATELGRLDEFRRELTLAFSKASNPEPPYARGDHCRWCTAQPICPMYKDVAQKLQALVEADDDPTDVETFTRTDLAEWMQTADIVTSWAKTVQALGMSEGLAGRPPTGKKMVGGLANTSWVSNDPKAIDRMLARFGLGLDDRRKPWQNVSPTQAEKLLKKVGKKLKAAVKQRLPGNPKLVDEDDERPALLTTDEKAAAAGAALGEMQDV